MCRDFEGLRKESKEAAHRQLLLDLMANAGILAAPGTGVFTAKDFLAAVREQEEFLKGGTPTGEKTPLEALQEFLA